MVHAYVFHYNCKKYYFWRYLLWRKWRRMHTYCRIISRYFHYCFFALRFLGLWDANIPVPNQNNSKEYVSCWLTERIIRYALWFPSYINKQTRRRYASERKHFGTPVQCRPYHFKNMTRSCKKCVKQLKHNMFQKTVKILSGTWPKLNCDKNASMFLKNETKIFKIQNVFKN